MSKSTISGMEKVKHTQLDKWTAVLQIGFTIYVSKHIYI